jgi:hypothetical protein
MFSNPVPLQPSQPDLNAGLLDKDLRRFGPFTRKVLWQLRRRGTRPRGALYRAMGVRRRPGRRREARALGTVLVRAALDLARATREGAARKAYELFVRDDCPLECPSTLPFGEALIRALPRGEAALAKVVVREAAAVLKQIEPSRRLKQEVARHIELFELLAYEGSRLQVS